MRFVLLTEHQIVVMTLERMQNLLVIMFTFHPFEVATNYSH